MNRLAVVTIALLILSGCGGRQPAAEDDPTLELERMAGDFPRLVGAARCENVAQCRSIGIGAKPCGGPWDYLIYSILDTDVKLLNERVTAARAPSPRARSTPSPSSGASTDGAWTSRTLPHRKPFIHECSFEPRGAGGFPSRRSP